MSDDRDVRQQLADAIQSTRRDSELEDSILMGFICIAEWMDPEGMRWLSVVAGDALANSAPDWQIQGYLHNVLNDWSPGEPAEADEDEE